MKLMIIQCQLEIKSHIKNLTIVRVQIEEEKLMKLPINFNLFAILPKSRNEVNNKDEKTY